MGSETEFAVCEAVRPFRAPPEEKRDSLEQCFLGFCSI